MKQVIEYITEADEDQVLQEVLVAKILRDVLQVNPLNGVILMSAVDVLTNEEDDHPLFNKAMDMISEVVEQFKNCQSILIEDMMKDKRNEVKVNANGDMVLDVAGQLEVTL
jgi:hypothetical protein